MARLGNRLVVGALQGSVISVNDSVWGYSGVSAEAPSGLYYSTYWATLSFFNHLLITKGPEW